MEYLRKIYRGENETIGKDEKIIVFCHHQEVLNILQRGLEEIKVDFIRMDGTTSSDVRPKLVESFQTKPFIKVALLSIKVAGVGKNFFCFL